MTFLALTPAQTALLALLVAGTIVALYFLKLRHRKILISSSLLWRRVLEDQQSHSLFEKLRRIISILIAVTIGLLIALGLARPEIEALTGRTERIVVVLDTSPTMGTLAGGGRTRWERAVSEATGLLSGGGPTTEFRVSDTSGRISSGYTTDRSELRELISKMQPTSAEPKFPKIDTASSMVYFVSDGVSISQLPTGVRRISVFEEAQNAGITAFEIRSKPAAPQSYEAFLEVQNFGKEAVEANIMISGAGGQRINRTATLGSEPFQEAFDLTAFEGGAIRATVQSKNDALGTDNVAFAYLPIKRKTRTLLVTRGNVYLRTLLELNPAVDVTIVEPASFKESSDVDVYIFDRYAPPSPVSRPALIVGTPEVSWLRPAQGIVQKPDITTWSEDHPVMKFVPLHDLTIHRAARIDARDLTVIASSSQTPLIVASDRPRWVMLTFDLDSSDFPLHIGFPIFIENVLSWFSRDQLAIKGAPGTVEVPLANAQVRTIDGKVLTAHQQFGKTVFDATEPGLYTAVQGDTRMHVAVNLANRSFSDVNRSSFETGELTISEGNLLKRELWFYMLLAAVILIAGEWYTYHKRITL